jgi:hypothetical protein
MTALATPEIVDHLRRQPTRTVPIIAAGLFGGFALGVIARAWMRLIAEDPEFTWGGTIFIVSGFTIFGLTQSIAAAARRRTSRRWLLTVARAFGTIGFLPLFVGAGAIMLPTVVGGGLARARADWPRWLRVICALAAMGPVVLVGSQIQGDFEWSAHTLVGFLAFLMIYAAIIAATTFTITPLADGWRLSRRIKVPIFVILGLVLAYSLVGIAR